MAALNPPHYGQSKLVVHCAIGAVLTCGLSSAASGNAQIGRSHKEPAIYPSSLTNSRTDLPVVQQSPRQTTFAAGTGESQNAERALLAGKPAPRMELTLPEIVELQRLLNDLGFDLGAADGAVGPRTRAAIRRFQELHDLQADGSPTPALLERIRHSGQTLSRPQTDAPVRAPAYPDGLSAMTAAHARGGRPDSAVPDGPGTAGDAPQRRLFEDLLVRDFFGATSVEKPWRIAGEGFEPHWRLGMRAGDDERGLYRALQKVWFTAAGIFGLSGPASRSAELYAERPFSGPFTLKVGFRTDGNGGRLLIGPYLDRSRQDGYRVVYSPEDGHRVSLLWLQDGRSFILARLEAPVRLRRGILHELIWSRTSERGLEAAIDGRAIFTLEDPYPDSAFDGVTIVAQNGAFSIAGIELRGTPTEGNLSLR